MTGILKGIDKIKEVSISTLVFYYIIGLPLMYIFAFNLNLGLSGIWLGFACANIGLIIYFSFELIVTNWKDQAIKVIEKLSEDRSPNE